MLVRVIDSAQFPVRVPYVVCRSLQIPSLWQFVFNGSLKYWYNLGLEQDTCAIICLQLPLYPGQATRNSRQSPESPCRSPFPSRTIRSN